ncbi:hypothetical protein D3C85_1696180 [compost metagenome]
MLADIASISPFLKAAIWALVSSWRNTTFSSTGLLPHHFSLGTRDTVLAAVSYWSSLKGPAIHSGCMSPLNPSLKISGELTAGWMRPVKRESSG